MTLKTVPVAGTLYGPNGAVLAGATVVATLTVYDTDGGVVVPGTVSTTTASDGTFTLNLWPNSRGVNGSQYKVQAQLPGALPGVLVLNALITVPDSDPNTPVPISVITNRTLPGVLTDAKAAMLAAQGFVVQAQAVLSDPNFVAVHGDLTNIDAVAADIANINAVAADKSNIDTVAGALAQIDAIQADAASVNSVAEDLPNIDSVAANIAAVNTNASNIAAIQSASANANSAGTSATQANGSALTAAAQASLAAGYAASAASVAQQDLSGTVAAALHRSPNPVVATCFMDTSKDSNPGWPAQVDASYLYESLNGKWLGSQASEAAARAVSGATTGDYFQLTTDGKFYKLNAGAGTTEVFRGNKARCPRLALAVAEASRVVVYDLLEPGRPMWRVFLGSGSGAATALSWNTSTSISSVAYREGWLMVGAGPSNGGVVFDLAKDDIRIGHPNAPTLAKRRITDSNSANTVTLNSSGYALASATVNSIAATTMPDAPVDPVTGLQVPTIAVATNGGTSVIKHDGSVVNSLNTGAFTGVTITPYAVIACNGSSQLNVALTPKTLGASFALTGINGSAAPGFSGGYSGVNSAIAASRSLIGARSVGGPLALLKFNESNPIASLTANIASTYNTGWMSGDIRRAILCDTLVGAVGGELFADPGFDNPAAWTLGDAQWAIGGSGATYTTAAGVHYITPVAPVPASANEAYTATFTISGIGAGTAFLGLFNETAGQGLISSIISQSGPSAVGVGPAPYMTFTANGTYTVTFLCSNAANNVRLYSSVNGVSFTLNDFSLKRQVTDRSYKGKNASIFGTLTRSQVGVGSQLVAYSGWSPANYVQEQYSADLDFPSSFALLPWVSIPAAPPAGSFQTTGAEKIANGDFSGGLTGWTQTVGANGSINIDGAGRVALRVTSGFGITFIAQNFGPELAGKTLRVICDADGTTSARPRVSVTVNPFVSIPAIDPAYPVAGRALDFYIPAGTTGGTITFQNPGSAGGVDCTVYFDNISAKEVIPAAIVDRSAPAGPYWRLGCWPNGMLTGEVNDGVNPSRTITSTSSYAGAGAVLPELSLSTSGTLTLKVNGNVAAQTTGAPLGTLANASAVLTIGNRRTLDAAFPGSIALVRPTATVPTDDASQFIFQQERAMFRDGAQVTLPDSGACVDLDYDPQTDCWRVASPANESEIHGLVRTAFTAAAAGSISKIAGRHGMKVVARTTTSPGVDITMPSQNLKEELLRKGEQAAAERARLEEPLDWTGGFTGTLTLNANTITSVSGLDLPVGATAIGAQVSHANLPAGTTILGIVGTTMYLSANATAGAAGASIAFLDFIGPAGAEWKKVFSVGLRKREGSTKDFTKLFDGFRERARFPAGAPPGATVNVTGDMRRIGS